MNAIKITQADIRALKENPVWKFMSIGYEQQKKVLVQLRDDPKCEDRMRQYYMGQIYMADFMDEQLKAIEQGCKPKEEQNA